MEGRKFDSDDQQAMIGKLCALVIDLIQKLQTSPEQRKEKKTPAVAPSTSGCFLSPDSAAVGPMMLRLRSASLRNDPRAKTPTPHSSRQKVNVFVHAHVLKLGEIDTIQEKFHVEIVIHSSWRDPLLDGLIKGEDFQWDESSWNPELYIENSFPETEERVSYRLQYDERGEATVEERRHLRGKFFECLELFEYPFDKQELTVKVTTTRSDEEVTLEPHPSISSSINVDFFTDRQSWKLKDEPTVWRTVRSDQYSDSNDRRQQVLCVTCHVQRLSQFFLWNVILIMLFLGVLTFSTFTVTMERVEARLVLSFILLLSNITFKLTVSKMIPKVPYLTYMDKYILTTIGLLCFIPIWHTIAHLIYRNSRPLAITLDRGALGLIAAAYLFFNVVFFALALTRRRINQTPATSIEKNPKQE